MKSRKPLLSALVAGTLMFAGTLIAQDVPPPPPPPSTPAAPATPATPDTPMPPDQTTPPAPPPASAAPSAPMPPAEPMPAAPPAPATPPAPADGQAATYQAPQGEVIVQSSPAPAPTIGPAPAFEQLSGGGKSITADQAVAYPPLANDFINADSNRNGSVSKTEYTNWTKQL